eukprot:g3836.t1
MKHKQASNLLEEVRGKYYYSKLMKIVMKRRRWMEIILGQLSQMLKFSWFHWVCAIKYQAAILRQTRNFNYQIFQTGIRKKLTDNGMQIRQMGIMIVAAMMTRMIVKWNMTMTMKQTQRRMTRMMMETEGLWKCPTAPGYYRRDFGTVPSFLPMMIKVKSNCKQALRHTKNGKKSYLKSKRQEMLITVVIQLLQNQAACLVVRRLFRRETSPHHMLATPCMMLRPNTGREHTLTIMLHSSFGIWKNGCKVRRMRKMNTRNLSVKEGMKKIRRMLEMGTTRKGKKRKILKRKFPQLIWIQIVLTWFLKSRIITKAKSVGTKKVVVTTVVRRKKRLYSGLVTLIMTTKIVESIIAQPWRSKMECCLQYTKHGNYTRAHRMTWKTQLVYRVFACGPGKDFTKMNKEIYKRMPYQKNSHTGLIDNQKLKGEKNGRLQIYGFPIMQINWKTWIKITRSNINAASTFKVLIWRHPVAIALIHTLLCRIKLKPIYCYREALRVILCFQTTVTFVQIQILNLTFGMNTECSHASHRLKQFMIVDMLIHSVQPLIKTGGLIRNGDGGIYSKFHMKIELYSTITAWFRKERLKCGLKCTSQKRQTFPCQSKPHKLLNGSYALYGKRGKCQNLMINVIPICTLLLNYCILRVMEKSLQNKFLKLIHMMVFVMALVNLIGESTICQFHAKIHGFVYKYLIIVCLASMGLFPKVLSIIESQNKRWQRKRKLQSQNNIFACPIRIFLAKVAVKLTYKLICCRLKKLTKTLLGQQGKNQMMIHFYQNQFERDLYLAVTSNGDVLYFLVLLVLSPCLSLVLVSKTKLQPH